MLDTKKKKKKRKEKELATTSSNLGNFYELKIHL
jgi:hypothetical protein